MNVTLKQLRAFVAVACSGSFAEACEKVHLSQPALSIAIKNLEQAVGGPLLARSTRTLALTPEGDAFLPVARRLLLDWDAALEDVHNRFALRRGKLTLASMPSFACTLLPDVLTHFRRGYPAINVTVHDVVAEIAVDHVRNGRVELAVTFDPGTSHDLKFTPLFQDEFVAVMPAGHPLAGQTSVPWRQLEGQSFLALQRPSSTRALLDATIREQNLDLPIEIESHQLATLGRMAATGLGVSAVPALCRQQMMEMGAVCVPLCEPLIARHVGIVTRSRYPLSAAAAAMVGILRQFFLRGPDGGAEVSHG